MSPTRIFWSWHRPLLDHAVGFLLEGWRPGVLLDLTDTLIIVPSAEAARRLKEAVARELERHEAGVILPWVLSPEQALLSGPEAEGVTGRRLAKRMQEHLAWHRTLETGALTELPALFPKQADTERRRWAWRGDMAEMLGELRALLGAGGFSFAEMARAIPDDADRWRDLAVLEARFLAEMETAGLVDAQAAKSTAAARPRLPVGVRRVVILAAPDLPPLFDRWVAACGGQGVPVTVAIHAPAELGERFDAVGRPLPLYWGDEADQTAPVTHEQVHIHQDAAAQAEAVLNALGDSARLARTAVGVADPEVAAILEEKLGLEDARAFQPGGVPVRESGLWHILSTVRALMAAGSWKAFATLLRVPEVRRAWAGGGEGGLGLLEAADSLAAEHLPVTVEHALHLMGRLPEPCDEQTGQALGRLRTALESARELITAFHQQALPAAARGMLIDLYGERQFSPEAPGDQLTTELATKWLRLASEVEEETARFGLKPTKEEAFDLTLQLLAGMRLPEPRGEVDLVLHGWLELHWERAPRLLVAGVNEEFVPGIFLAHPFLPDGARRKLGLPCQDTRFARDAYVLRALAEQRMRQEHGALHLFCGQWSDRGEPLRPSRLLFLCADEELPQRVRRLFPREESGGGAAEPARTLGWTLQPRYRPREVATISPSRIRSYLACPLRDCFASTLRMEAVEPRKRELAASEFGSLIHHAFQQYAAAAEMRDCEDERAIAEFLIEAAAARCRGAYGDHAAPLVRLQFESLRQRLRHAAQIEADARRGGWRILEAEWRLGGKEDQQPLLIEGARLVCTVDRVERNEKTGQVRVLDFKTADQARKPREEHVQKVSARTAIEPEQEWQCFDAPDGTRSRWRDLQLPLYAAALRARGLAPDLIGYFAVPKTVNDTEILFWPNFGLEWADLALECAANVVRRLREGVYWPPAPRARPSDFDALFLGDPASAVAPPEPLAGGADSQVALAPLKH